MFGRTRKINAFLLRLILAWQAMSDVPILYSFWGFSNPDSGIFPFKPSEQNILTAVFVGF